jgi:hypothetical protein
MSIARAWAIGFMMIPVVLVFNQVVWSPPPRAPEAVTLPPQWMLPGAALPKKPAVNDIVGLRLDYPSQDAVE